MFYQKNGYYIGYMHQTLHSIFTYIIPHSITLKDRNTLLCLLSDSLKQEEEA